MTNDAHKFLSMYLFLFLTLYTFRAQLPEVVLTQFVPPDDEHDVLETCRELKIKIHTQKEICASYWSFNKNRYMMHGQQNIKYAILLRTSVEQNKDNKVAKSYTKNKAVIDYAIS